MTLLGSCVSVCMFDPVARLGGMNHFLLPGGGEREDEGALRFGANAMEKLVNGILKAGGKRDRLRCKAFGGAAIVPSLGRIGQENSLFVMHYLADEGIPCIARSLGGTQARRVRFWPVSGKAQQSLIQDDQAIVRQEEAYSRQETEAERQWAREAGSGVELF
ncbi:chemotaxis protein CheD [Gluconacetobacter sacchari]|uniref:Probable chemoreceptor glutamine deamidase CheD n=2 Tax=Gluconacetobacter sacchari TaxID=92759 RepID=A0A7W4I989_9PROT|nr:chemotaxis protein CheD [Gluconacetobacter sacchari]MBB2158627.1 chemotaxis protein CheD [Gluconacetobacter sacchari]